MKSIRRDRLQTEIWRTVSEILTQEVQDPRIRGITLKNVSLTNDGGIARIYYEANLPEKDQNSLAQALDRAKGFVRRELAKRLELRSVPQVEFYNE